MKVTRLSSLEALSSGFTHAWKIDVSDLTTTATNTAQVLDLRDMAKFEQVSRCGLYLAEELEDTGDAAFNNNTVSVGHTDGATAFVAATQFNANGSTVPAAVKENAHVFVADSKKLICTVNSMSAKSLSDLNKGIFYVFAHISDVKGLAVW